MEQLSNEWFKVRLGKVTASRINDVMATLKSGGEAADRKNYRAQLVVERMTGTKQDSYTNSAMQWGIDTEPQAREAYGADVLEASFIDHPVIKNTGASPDGLVGDVGLLEIKCPNTATHIKWLLAGEVPPEHKNQMCWQMECTGREWVDFVSFDPRMPEDLRLLCVRYHRDEAKLEEIRIGVIKFLNETDEQVNALQKLRLQHI